MNKPFPLPELPPRFTRENAATQSKKFAAALYSDFFNFPISSARQSLETSSASDWEEAGRRMALKVFHAAAERVPAYKDFLRKQNIDHKKIKNISDFQNVPPIDKDNYLRNYPLKDLSWDGILTSSQVISVSSGSTGRPFFWPRGARLELETTYLFELFMESSFLTNEKQTLFVNAFAMGMYVGGPITLNSSLRVSQKGHKVTIVTPGYSMEDILRVIEELGPQYEQVVIASYPPFAKDIIDEGTKRGIKWKKLNTRILLAGEGINESWRDYISKATGGISPVRDFINIYGTADAAILGQETPTSILCRRAIDSTEGGKESLFESERLPSFLQYIPTLRYFEVINNELHFTASAGVPLIRYNIHDRGGLMLFDDVEQFVRDSGFSLRKGLADAKLPDKPWKLPFVYIFGRSDFTSVLYGANIYPENIKAALETRGVNKKVSGKFTMFTDTDDQHQQFLSINVECKNGVRPSTKLARQLQKTIVKKLLDVNSEYGVVNKSVGKPTVPKIKLFPWGDLKYFDRGIKHNWTMK